ncbi:MAG: hypothetical protein KIT56_05545 [Gammaproteobacteria bacterium]|nr:hypothetical protein [Gammaproteobacteria bacterium]MCW5583335.1 hypothetical protein [Gammaproteobacteria bacterium]
MKKLLVLLATLASIQVALADDAANIKLKISGASSDNRYFLCLPDTGCLSILAAQKGKVFPILHPVEISGIFIADAQNNFAITPQKLPHSCHTTINTNQTATISGKLTTGKNKSVNLSQLNCTIS